MAAALSFEAAKINDQLAPTSPPAATGAAGDDQALEMMLEKSRKAAGYLCLLLHAKTCTGGCSNQQCGFVKQLHQHAQSCTQEDCVISGCAQTKKVLHHYAACRRARILGGSKDPCLVCSMAFRQEAKMAESRKKRKEEQFMVPLLPKRFRERHHVH